MAFSIFGKKNSESPLLDSPGENRYITKIEYVSLILSRIGGMFGTTLTGTLAATFLYELFFADFPEVGTEQIAGIAAVQTTIQYVLGIAMPLIAGVIVQKWKTKWGRYRQWYLLNLIPYFILTISFYWVPKGWTVQQMIWLRYGVAATQTVLNAFNVLSQNLIQVITPKKKKKKTVATLCVLAGEDEGTLFAASLTLIGNLMCGLFCKERIELPKKEKTKLSKSLFTLFKYKNYRAYQYFTWVNVFAGLGKWSTLLAGITVGSSNVILLTVPTAAGTVVGNVVCGVIARKHEPTKILKFCGVYSITAAAVLFGICYGEKVMGINFWEGGTAVFFYIFYFLFGVGVGFQELSMSHYTMEYNDYLEWQTGERLESVQGIIPGWINSGITYAKDLLIPYILVWVAYPTSDDRKMDLVDVIKNRIASGELSQEQYLTTCMWLLAFLLFGYALTNLLRALILKFFYNIEGEKKEQMYRELEEIRLKRHAENEQIAD